MEQYKAVKNKTGTPANAKGVRIWLVSAPAINDEAGENTGGGGAETIPEYDEGRDAIEVSVAAVRSGLRKWATRGWRARPATRYGTQEPDRDRFKVL